MTSEKEIFRRLTRRFGSCVSISISIRHLLKTRTLLSTAELLSLIRSIFHGADSSCTKIWGRATSIFSLNIYVTTGGSSTQRPGKLTRKVEYIMDLCLSLHLQTDPPNLFDISAAYSRLVHIPGYTRAGHQC